MSTLRQERERFTMERDIIFYNHLQDINDGDTEPTGALIYLIDVLLQINQACPDYSILTSIVRES
jgi:hypothetical protein